MTDAMLPNDALRAQLSAFIDDELPHSESDLLVRRLAKDAGLAQTLSRYQLIGEVLRKPQASPQLSRQFSGRVAAALQQQDSAAVAGTAATLPSRSAARWLKPVAGMAIAASVALLAVVIVRNQPLPASAEQVATEALQPVQLTAERSRIDSSADSYTVPAPSSAPSAPLPASRLTNYVVAHSEFSSPLGRRNMMTGLLADEPATPAEAVTETEAVSAQ